jgi:hypothetical protein
MEGKSFRLRTECEVDHERKYRELDPHGATGAGNPIGGNVTSNVTGSDQSYAEWMVIVPDIYVAVAD